MINKIDKNSVRVSRHKKIRQHLSGTSTSPRLCVYRSTSNIYAQIIDDTKSTTLVSASSLEKALEKEIKGKTKTEVATLIGETIAKRAIEAGIKTVVFDRGGYLYTGRVKAVADGARSAGLEF
ncbi:MAG: 50S ribosomal protein L18 [Christensenellales bacterium]